MAVIGYARTSTLHQDAGLDAQSRQLEALGCDKVFSEQVSSVADRARLAAALEYVREGDTFVVTKLDRLARSVAHLAVHPNPSANWGYICGYGGKWAAVRKLFHRLI
jgi:DNA invertase Pin-like site-specific DNA recombinase